MMIKKIKFRGNIQGSTPSIFEPIPEISYYDKKVRFSLKHCNTSSYCVTNLNNEEVRNLYKSLGIFEDLTWRDVRSMPREKGFSIEKKGDNNDKMLRKEYPTFDTFLHFRVKGLFRVFGAMQGDLCYILLFDSKGHINH